MTLPQRWMLGLVVLLSGLAMPATTDAHEFGARRQVLVEITPAGLEVLVTWSLGSSAESRLWDQLLDANADGRVDGPLERLAASRALLPYALAGLGVRVADQAPTLALVRAVFEPAPRTDTTAGWRGAVLLRLAFPFGSGEACTPVVIERLLEDGDAGSVGVAAALTGVRAEPAPTGQVVPLAAGASIAWCVRVL
jgi:hypothetical protein